MYVTFSNGVYFVEGLPSGAQIICPISTVLDGVFTQAQLKSLTDLKVEMARYALAQGGNAIVNFKYGQKAAGFWRSLFSLDDIIWQGEGQVAKVEANLLNPKP